jgi:hypothetical protein
MYNARGWLWLGVTLIGFLLLVPPVSAQPSGGPYGPVRKSYDLPKVSGKIYFVTPDGEAGRSGESLDRPTTLESAIERVRTGDAIVLRGGTYRTGGLKLNQGITIQPFKDELPVVKGTYVATKWEDLGNGLWVTSWDRLFPSKPADWWQRKREGKKTPLHRFNNDMVFVDGRLLQSAGWEGEVNQQSCYIDYNTNQVYIGSDPAGHLVEITAFDVALLRTTGECHGKASDRKGYLVRGIEFTQYAYRALEIEGTEPEGISDESRHGKEVVGTTLEDCTISCCSRVAGYFRGDRLTMRRCRISDTSTEGVYVIASNDVLLEQNVFTRNNIEEITGYYPAAVKIFNQSHRVTCRDNLVIDLPHSNGIWYDVGNVDGVFVNNWIERVGSNAGRGSTDRLWPSDNGFFFEISKGAVCAGNVFVNCDHGLMILNSADVAMVQNTFINSTACIGRNARSAAGDHFGWHPSTGPDVDKRDGHVFANNLLTADAEYVRPLLFVWQPDSLCTRLPVSQLKTMDHNVYIQEGPRGTPLLWSPTAGDRCQKGFAGVEEFRAQFPAFEEGGRSFAGYRGPLFVSSELGSYRPAPGSAWSVAGMRLPASVARILGRPDLESAYVGAYPARR